MQQSTWHTATRSRSGSLQHSAETQHPTAARGAFALVPRQWCCRGRAPLHTNAHTESRTCTESRGTPRRTFQAKQHSTLAQQPSAQELHAPSCARSAPGSACAYSRMTALHRVLKPIAQHSGARKRTRPSARRRPRRQQRQRSGARNLTRQLLLDGDLVAKKR